MMGRVAGNTSWKTTNTMILVWQEPFAVFSLLRTTPKLLCFSRRSTCLNKNRQLRLATRRFGLLIILPSSGEQPVRFSTEFYLQTFQRPEFWNRHRPIVDFQIAGLIFVHPEKFPNMAVVSDKRIRIEDRITELPVNIKEHILDCLSIKEAVATSVLSSKWRCCWTGLRKLKFDKAFWAYVGVIKFLEYARVIDRVLMLHCGPIREFLLYIPDLKHKLLDINMWLRVLSNNGVRAIEIDALQYKDIQTDGPFPMPSCLFQCRELETLSLSNCKLTLPSDFKSFVNLTSLSLESVEIEPSVLESLISECLLLESLSLTDLNLQEPLAIEALNLKSFDFDDSELENIIFKEIPKLESVSLLATNENDKIDTPQLYSTLDVLSSLSGIKELTFDFLLLEPLSDKCPGRTHVPLENLKSLTLSALNLCFSDDILFTLCLLRSAPNLQSLTIYLDSNVGCRFKIKKSQAAAAKLLESEAKKTISYRSINTVKIRGIDGLRHEILLIKILQTRCRKLKSIIIESGC